MKFILGIILSLALFGLITAQNAHSTDLSVARKEALISVGPTVVVSKGQQLGRTQWEPVIAANPNNPTNLVACWIDGADGVRGFQAKFISAVIVSTTLNAGKSWRKSLQIDSEDFTLDPSCVFGPDGTAYVTAMSKGMPVYRSTDSGMSWLKVSEFRTSIDREYLTVDSAPGKNRGRVFFHGLSSAFTLLEKNSSATYLHDLQIWRSNDRGASFWGPARLVSKLTSRISPGTATVTSDGSFYAVVGQQSRSKSSADNRVSEDDRIIVVRADDDNWPHPQSIAVNEWHVGEPDPNGCFPGHPVIASDTDPNRKNRLYVVWPDRRRGSYDLLLSFSSDMAKTWSVPAIVSKQPSESIPSGGDDCVPEISVNSAGVVGLLWYRKIDHPHLNAERSVSHETWFTPSLDGGTTFLPAVKLSGLILPKSFRIGETVGLAAGADGRFHALWVENRTGVPQINYAAITVNANFSKVQASCPLSRQDAKELRKKILDEEIRPLLKKSELVDWALLEKQLAAKYGATLARQLISRSKPIYHLQNKNWTNVEKSLSDYINRYGTEDLTADMLNSYAWNVFENSDDKKILEQAAKWSFKSIELLKDEAEFFDTYANVLYRLGRTREAIEWQEKARDLAKSEDGKNRFQATIDKMKKGEPTWPVK